MIKRIGCLVVAVIGAWFVACDVASAAFINGVETFDGTVKDLTTWDELNGPAISQNNRLSIEGGGAYFTRTVTADVGQTLSAKVALTLGQSPATSANLVFTEHNFVNPREIGVTMQWRPTENRFWFGLFSNDYRSQVASLAGPHFLEFFTLEAERVSPTVLRASIYDAGGTLLGSLTEDFTQTAGHTPVLGGRIIAISAGDGIFDDVRITPEPAGGVTAALAALSLLGRRRRVARGRA